MINTEKYIKQQPDREVQRMISIFGKKKCACGCDGTHGDGGTVAPMAHNLITGSGFPSEETVGNLGDYYRDELNNRTFECVDITEENEGINGQPAAQASDGEDISYINIDSLDEGEYAVLITSSNQVRNLYQKQNGEPVELPFEQFSTENDIYFNSDVKHAVVINGGNNLFYIYTHAETYKKYHWAATEHRTIDLIMPDEVTKELQNIGIDLIDIFYYIAENFRDDLKELYTGDNISFYDENENYFGTIEATKSITSWFDETERLIFDKQTLYEIFILHPAPCTDGGEEIKIEGEGEPNYYTQAKVGQKYVDTDSGEEYICIERKNLYARIEKKGSTPIFSDLTSTNNVANIKRLTDGTPFIVATSESRVVSTYDLIKENLSGYTHTTEASFYIKEGVDSAGNLLTTQIYPATIKGPVDDFEEYIQTILDKFKQDQYCQYVLVKTNSWYLSDAFKIYTRNDIINEPLTLHYWTSSRSPLTPKDICELIDYKEPV